MNTQEKISRIYVFAYNLKLMGNDTTILDFTPTSSFLINALAKYPAGYSPKGTWEYKKRESWTFAEAVLLEETIWDHIYSDLAVPFLKDPQLIAMVDEVRVEEKKNNCSIRPDAFPVVTPAQFHEHKGALIDLCGTIGCMEGALTNNFDDFFYKIDNFFEYSDYDMYKNIWQVYDRKHSLCLSSIPETDFDANYTEALKSIKND